MTISADTSEVTSLAGDLLKLSVTAPIVAAATLKIIAPKVLEEQRANVPVLSGDLMDSLGIAWKGTTTARVGAVVPGSAGWRAHFTEDGTVHSAPQPFIRPAGDKFANEFATTILRLAGRI
jgi:HK97 gp10 family phage protein